MSRRLAAAGLVAMLVALALPAPVLAHGLSGRTDLPVPDWLFTWGAAAVLVVSFVGLAVLWPSPRLQQPGFRPLPTAIGRVVTSRVVEIVCGATGVALLVFTVYCGLRGAQVIAVNFAPTFVYVAFWLALVPVSVVFGDVFRLFNPWRAIGRATGWALGRALAAPPPALPYPERLGYWPAAIGLFAFGYLELVAEDGSDPSTLVVAALIYTAITLVAMALYGVDVWIERGEAFSVYFGLFARMSVFERRGRRVGLRRFLSGLPGWSAGPGSVALLAVMIGVVSFDGLSAGKPYSDLIDGIVPWLDDDIGLSSSLAVEVVYGVSLLAAVALTGAFYMLGVAGAHTVDRTKTKVELARAFVHSLVPIALAYVAAHYVSFLLFQGQALGFIISDPLGRGEDYLGTADWVIDYDIIGAEMFWYLQVAFVVLGHIAGLVLAHDRALVLFTNTKNAVRSQYWLLCVMIGYTTLALWLLAQARSGG